MSVRTHAAIDQALCGSVTSLGPGRSTVEMETTPAMTVDEHGLIHGGFIFGLADHAAMVAINEPTVVLTAASVRFLRPATAGDTLAATARADGDTVHVTVACGEVVIMSGEFSVRVLERHVLDR